MRKGILLTCLLAMISVNGFAASAENFSKRFKLVRKEGKLVEIRDRVLTTKFSIRPYIKFIKERLIQEQKLMDSKSDYFYELESALTEEFTDKGAMNSENVQYVIESMEEVRKLDVDAIFKNEGFKEVINKFEFKISEALSFINPTVMARLDKSNYFFVKRATYQALTFALNFARKRLSSVPVLNTAFYVLVEAERMIRERREFRQNMLLHYMENFAPETLGMTHDEVNYAMSSIYESKIPWFAVWESRAAGENWYKFGVNKFFTNVRMANTKLRNNRGLYDALGGKVNFAFQKATYKGERVLLNLFDNQNLLAPRPSVAYNYDKPNKVARLRSILQLSNLGLSFLPLPNFIKQIAETYIKSFYDKQRLTEGSMYAYFESTGNEKMKKEIVKQYLNPFDTQL